MSSLILYALLLLPVLFVLATRWRKRARVINYIDKLPGPKAYPIIGNSPTFFNASREEIFNIISDIAKKYGPLYRMWAGWIPEVDILDPKDFEVVLSSSKHLDKAPIYAFLHSWLGTGLLTSTGSKWHSHRKMITPTFHFKILDNFVQVFNENSEVLVQNLKKEIKSEKFNVYPYITACALDIICETAMGTKINAQSSSSSGYVNAVYRLSELTIYRLARPWLYPNWTFNLSPTGRESAECLKILHGFTNRVIKERKQERTKMKELGKQTNQNDELAVGMKKREAFLDLLIEASVNGTKLTDQEIREEVDTFMFEGHDTTATGMCWALFTLGSHPEIQDKIFEELSEIFGDSDRPATMQDLNNMQYLERCIKETLRLYPSVPQIGRTATEDFKLGGYTIPKDTQISIHIYDAHRNPEIFPNPDEFNPDNFLPEKVKTRHPYAYIPFSAGPRNCIGQKFAMLEEKTIISNILRHFKVTALDKKEDIVSVGELVLRPLHGINLKIEPRRKTN